MTLTIFGIQVTITRVMDLATEEELIRAMKCQAIERKMARIHQAGIDKRQKNGWLL
jgi:hypothetical protein